MLDADDRELSMRIAPRGRRNDNLRTLLVHRLKDTLKAVLRLSIATGRTNVFCEPCGQWMVVEGFPAEWTCPRCQRKYAAEMIIYEEVEP